MYNRTSRGEAVHSFIKQLAPNYWNISLIERNWARPIIHGIYTAFPMSSSMSEYLNVDCVFLHATMNADQIFNDRKRFN